MRHLIRTGREEAECAARVVRAHRVSFGDQRERVDTAKRELDAVLIRPHSPREARAAADDLARALRAATAAAVECLRVGRPVLAPAAAAGRPASSRRSPDPVAVQRCTAQLVELGLLRTWLSQTVRDDPGVEFATTVQVGSRAASGPHVAGLEAEPADLVEATLHQPRIGVPLRDVIDRVPVPARA